VLAHQTFATQRDKPDASLARAKAKLGLVPTFRKRFGVLETQGIHARAQAVEGLVPEDRKCLACYVGQAHTSRTWALCPTFAICLACYWARPHPTLDVKIQFLKAQR
jgi:hypothetical protein